MKIIPDTDKNLKFIPIEEAIKPSSGFLQHIQDSWWVVHPKKGLVIFRKTSPQCNRNEEIARRLAVIYPWAEVRLIPSVFLKVNLKDWMD